MTGIIETRSQVGASFIRDNGITTDQNTHRQCYTETNNPHFLPRYQRR
jgi:hypothetical protein